MSDARSVLGAMLDCVRRGGDTPLQFGIDSAAIVRAQPDFRCVEAAELDAAATELLGAPWSAGAASVESWLDRFYAAARVVDPQAIEIVGLRLEGFDDREIADRLSLGPRLVRRILRDIACSSP